MKARRLFPVLLLAASLVALVPAERSLRQTRAAASHGTGETGWVRYVMVGLGGFRGVISEILWIRAATLQEQGRYFELVQLADWITALDPRAADAWVFNAWNLSYNVPAMLPDHRARLNWVRAGLSLLADKAIPANPDNPRLYRELGWLYQHKIGSDADDASILYKLALAQAYPDRAAVTAPGSGLNPAAIAEIESRLGELDWRLAPAHAVYWAWCGLKFAPNGFEREALRRMIRQNALSLVTDGRFTGDIAAGRFATAPNFAIVPGLVAFCEETLREDPGDIGIYSLTLSRIVQELAAAERSGEARKLYARLAELLPRQGQAVPTFEEVAKGKWTMKDVK